MESGTKKALNGRLRRIGVLPFLGILVWAGCANEHMAYDHFSMQRNRRLVQPGEEAMLLPDSRELETSSSVGGNTLHLEIVFPPHSFQVYASSFPPPGDSAIPYQVDIHQDAAGGSGKFPGPRSALLTGIPFAEPDSSWYAQLEPAIEGTKLEWKKAVQYRISWDGKTVSGECHMQRYSHKERGNLGSTPVPPRRRIQVAGFPFASGPAQGGQGNLLQ